MAARKDATVKLMVNSAIFWLVVAITLGLIQAIEFIAPDMLPAVSRGSSSRASGRRT